MVSLRHNDHNLSVNQKTKEFMFSCVVGESGSLTVGEIKAEATDLLTGVLQLYDWSASKVFVIEVQPNLFNDDTLVKIRGIINED